jgi:hypothetical protein
MATLDSLQFEMERRVILFKPTTTMPDSTQLGYNADPNLIVSPATAGEELLYYSPNNTRYVNYDASGNTITEWTKKSQPNGWVPLGGGDSSINDSGTVSPTWQLNIDSSGVILEDASSNLVIKGYDGSLATLIVGSLKIDNITGYLRAQDGSIFADPSINTLLTGTGTLTGDNFTKDFVINHNLNTLNHIVSIYTPGNQQIYPDVSIGTNIDIISFSDAPAIGVNHRAVIIGF